MRALTTVFNLITILIHIPDITRSSTKVISCALNACRNTTIDCVRDSDCFVSCSTANGCHNSLINCPPSQECIVLCDDIESCKGATINGTHSSILHITGCIHDQSCLNLNIYCPQMIENDDPNCFLQGNDNLGSFTTIYAAFGWNQMNIEFEGTFNNNLSGKLFCNTDYETSCAIASDEWSCIESDNYCNDISYIRSTATEDIQSVTEEPQWLNMDTEMLIIVTTMIAAFCFISLCCWMNRYKTEQRISKEIPMTTTINKERGEVQAPSQPQTPQSPQSQMPFNTTLPKQRTRSEPMRVKKKAAAMKQARYRKSTGGAREKKKKKKKAQYIPPIDTNISGAKQMKQEVVKIEVDSLVEKEKVRQKQNANGQNQKRKKLKENDLPVINESAPVETNEKFVHTKAVNRRLQFRADASDSDTMNMKLSSPADTIRTWDNFDQENGILDDRVNMNQMMGFLEEGAIACSYE